MNDKDILKYIKELVSEEQNLYSKGELTEEEKAELQALQVELDQYWDLLRQRRALREFGENPDKAGLRSPDITGNYEQ